MKVHIIFTLALATFILGLPTFGWAQQDNTMSRMPGDTTKARTLVQEAEQLNHTGNYKDAYEKAKAAIDLSKASINEESVLHADAVFQFGNAQAGMSDFEGAIQSFKTSLTIRAKLLGMESIAVAKTCNNLAFCFSYINAFDSSLVYYSRQLKIYKKFYGEDNPQTASVLRDIGEVYLFGTGNFKIGISYYQQALKIYKKDYEANKDELGAIYNNLVYGYETQGDFDNSIEYGKLSLNIYEELNGPNSPEVGLAIMNIGNTYRGKGDYLNATDSLKKAALILKKALGEEHQNVGRAYNGLGLLFERIGDNYKALEYYQKTLFIMLKNYGDNHPTVAVVYQNLGNCYRNLGNYEKSIECFNNAININQNFYSENSNPVAMNYSGLGSTYGSMGKFDEAGKWHEKALEIDENLNGVASPSVAGDYQNLGLVYRYEGDTKKAVEYFKKSLAIKDSLKMSPSPLMASTFGDLALAYCEGKLFVEGEKAINLCMSQLNYKDVSSLDKVSSISQLLKSLEVKGRLYYDWYLHTHNSQYLYVAYQSYSEGVSIIDYQRRYFDNPGSKISLARESIGLFEGAIRTGYLTGHFQNILGFSEKSKSMVLFESIKQVEMLHAGKIPDSLLNKEYNLRVEMIAQDKRRQELISKKATETDSTVLEVTSKLFDITRQFETLTQHFKQKYSEYYDLKYGSDVVSVQQIQNELLNANQTLLEYFTGDSAIYIFLLQKYRYKVVEVKYDGNLDTLVNQMVRGIDAYYGKEDPLDDMLSTGNSKYTDAAYQLYQKLIAPVDSLLTEELIIIPDGVLGYVPFEALLKKKPDNPANFRTHQYLLKEHSISYAQSALLLKEMVVKNYQEKQFANGLVMAPFSQGNSVVSNRSGSNGCETLPALISSKVEADSVRDILLKAEVLFDSLATLKWFKEKAEEYRFIHLSTHGAAYQNAGDYSYIAFYQNKDCKPDGKLYVRDIYNLNLHADMVVLSACETAIGELRRGEGIIGMARAFTYAGTKSLFVTLWQVNDEATKNLVVSFYENLKAGVPKNEALQKAKLKLIEKGEEKEAHPYFWAGMIGIGDMRAVQLSK